MSYDIVSCLEDSISGLQDRDVYCKQYNKEWYLDLHESSSEITGKSGKLDYNHISVDLQPLKLKVSFRKWYVGGRQSKSFQNVH